MANAGDDAEFVSTADFLVPLEMRVEIDENNKVYAIVFPTRQQWNSCGNIPAAVEPMNASVYALTQGLSKLIHARKGAAASDITNDVVLPPFPLVIILRQIQAINLVTRCRRAWKKNLWRRPNGTKAPVMMQILDKQLSNFDVQFAFRKKTKN
jgi:hypothetical protein